MLKGLPNKYQQMFSDVPEKEDKKIEVTSDNERFYRVVDNIFYVPPLAYLQDHIQELTTLQESFESYYHSENEDPAHWNLENLDVNHYTKASEVIEFFRHLNKQEIIAVDIETTGFSLFDDDPLLIVFSWGEDSAATIEYFTHTIIMAMRQLFANEDITFVWHNGKFDIIRMKAFFDIDARVDEDTMLMHYIGFNENRGTHGLGYLAMLHLSAPNWEKDLDKIRRRTTRDLGIKQADFNYGMFPKEDLIHYAYYDGLATYRLYKHFQEQFPEDRRFIYNKLIEASNSLAKVELTGVYADQEMIAKLDKELTEEYNQLMIDIVKEAEDIWDPEQYMIDSKAKTAPDEFNPNSPKQLKWVLQQFGHTVDSTSVDVLEELDSLFVDLILRLRRNNKYRRTYVHGLRENIDSDGRIHTNFNLHGTVTGRLSSSNPNLQNIPRDKTIKNIFKATPGKVLIQADYSQAELRVMAVLSNDPWLQGVYKDGKDLHDEVALEHWGEDFDEEDRTKAKAVNFGIAYGRGAGTLAADLNMSFQEAEKLLKDWYEPMPYVKKYFDDKVQMAFEEKVSITPFNRHRNFIVTSRNKHSVRNEAMNTTIQATASDLTLFSLIEIERELRERNLGQVVLTVHDSIIAEIDPEDKEEAEEVMVRHMTEVPKKYLDTEVPFDVDIDVGTLWGELD